MLDNLHGWPRQPLPVSEIAAIMDVHGIESMARRAELFRIISDLERTRRTFDPDREDE